MKNKISILLIIILILYFCFNLSYATKTGTVYLESSRDIVQKGDEIEITVNLKDAKTAAFNFSLYFDNSKFEVISKLDNMNLIDNHIIFVWHDTTGGSNEKDKELAKFKFRAKDDGIATFTVQGEFYSQIGQLIQTNFEEKQIQVGKEESILEQQSNEQGTDSNSSNANLQAFRLNYEGLTPKFDKEIYEYYLTIPDTINDLEVLTVAENPDATVEITGNTNLKEGSNIINIQVISKDKTQKRLYSIQVTKTANLELANTNLEILAIEDVLLNPPFDINETNYKVEVSNNSTSINIFAVPENEQAIVEISGKDNLKEGNNLVTVLVTAQNGFTKKKYQVEVYRRNAQQEKKYQEEIEENKNNLENAYRLEELSGKNSITETESNTHNNKYVWVIVSAIVFILICGVCILYLKYKKPML